MPDTWNIVGAFPPSLLEREAGLEEAQQPGTQSLDPCAASSPPSSEKLWFSEHHLPPLCRRIDVTISLIHSLRCSEAPTNIVENL